MGVTINDLIMGVCSTSLKEYMAVRGDDKSSFVTLGVPFSLRPAIMKKIDFKFDNDFVLIPFPLDLINNLQDALRLHKQNMDKIKKSLMPVGMYFL
mmetsp:Transcript_28917/g.27851  ORF Transcript_28917/g.27851 Transcript_28917/m.27851 type:complete len:96 (+) Transcript_28917:838-1125(+)